LVLLTLATLARPCNFVRYTLTFQVKRAAKSTLLIMYAKRFPNSDCHTQSLPTP
jgi:hypothetical protein